MKALNMIICMVSNIAILLLLNVLALVLLVVYYPLNLIDTLMGGVFGLMYKAEMKLRSAMKARQQRLEELSDTEILQ